MKNCPGITLPQRTLRSLEIVDAMPSRLRGCVHEYGYAIVQAMLQAKVTDPDRIHNLVREVWAGARQPHQRTGQKGGRRSPICDQLDWLLIQAGADISAEGFVRLLRSNNMMIVPMEPSPAMIAASLDATNHMGRVTKEQKHRNRLRSALFAGLKQFWPSLSDPSP